MNKNLKLVINNSQSKIEEKQIFFEKNGAKLKKNKFFLKKMNSRLF